MIKKTFFILSASLPLLASADEARGDNSDCCPLLPPEPVASCQLPVGYFYPAQYALRNCGVNLNASGEFLYWELNEDSLEQIATRITGLFAGGTGLETTFDLLSHYQGYRPGFRVGIGMGLPCYDNWDFDLEYTWFNHKTTKHFSASGEGDIIVGQFIPTIYDVASTGLRSERRMNLNYLYALVGKSFYLSQRFIVKTGCGLKAWWMDEDFNLRFNMITTDIGTQSTKLKMWGIGPYVQAKIRALLWCGTYIQGKAGVYTTYNRQHKYRTETNFPAITGFFLGFTDDQTTAGKQWAVRLFYEGGVALGWGAYFCNCGYHADLSVGYDMMSTYSAGFAVTVGNRLRAFYYQGLSVRAQLDF